MLVVFVMPDFRRERIECDHGPIEITFPSIMSPQDVNDFEERVKIVIRVMRRMAVDTPKDGASGRDEAMSGGG